jgi:integrase
MKKEQKLFNDIDLSVAKYFREERSHLSEESIKNETYILTSFMRSLRDPLEIKKRDVVNYVNSNDFKSLKKTTQNIYKYVISDFLEYIGMEEDLSCLKKARIIEKELKKSDLLTKEEIHKQLKAFKRPIEKAVFMLILETKARKTEIITLKVGDIEINQQYGIVYIGESKTAQRNIPIIESIPFLTRYLEDHPKKDDNNAALFGHMWRGEWKRYDKNWVNEIFHRRNILDKNLYPHLLRHTGLTQMSKHLSEFQLKKLAGWTMNSKQAARYVHLGKADLENKMLSLYGLKELEKDDKVENIKIIECPRCNYQNSELDTYCSRCGSVLHIKTVLEHKEKAKELEKDVSQLNLENYIDKILEQKLSERLRK